MCCARGAQAAEADARTIRALALEVLKQRSDVEKFLIAAIREAQGQAETEAQKGYGAGGASRVQVTGWASRSSSQTSAPGVAASKPAQAVGGECHRPKT